MSPTKLIDRGNLLVALDRAVAGDVTIISAPAGSAKTSLLCAWGRSPRVAGAGSPSSKSSATSTTPQAFWLALLDAVRLASGTAGEAEPAAATPEFNRRVMVTG